ncbi:MAG: zinc ribbon domain-containing protein [Pseudomonadota bacterium]
MPIYEYRCQDCQNVFEEWLKNFNDDAPNCPSCGGQAERIMSNTTFVLKGGGWYVTEYGNKGEGPVSAAHGDTAAGQNGAGQNGAGQNGAGHSETKADNKADSNADSKAAKPAAPAKATPAPHTSAATPASSASTNA